MRVAGEEGVVIAPAVEDRARERHHGADLPASPRHGGEKPGPEAGFCREPWPAPGPSAGGEGEPGHQGVEPVVQAGTVGDEGGGLRHVRREEGLRERRAEPGDVGAQAEGQ